MTALAPKQLAHLRGRNQRALGGVDHEAMFRATFETVPVAISHTRPSDGGWLRMNPALCKMLDYTAKELTLLSWHDLTHPEDIAADLSQYDRMTSGEIDSYKLIKRYIRKGGSSIWARVSISLIDDNVSEPYVLAVAEDITTSVEDQRALQESEERYRTLVDMSPDAIVVIADHKVVYGNASAERLFGAGSADRLLGAESKQLINPSLFDSLSETVATALESREPTDLSGDHLRRLDGADICAELQLVIVPVSFESVPATQIIIRDVTEQKRAEERLRYQATHDDLTGLPNRHHLFSSLEAAVDRDRNLTCSVLLMDLDRFKEVNDTFGHHYGDLLLAQLGPRLQDLFPDPKPVIARLGGDEFAVVLAAGCEELAADTAGRLLECVRQPFLIDGQNLEIGASIGVAVGADHGADVNELLRRADVAMYVAKRDRKGFAFYETQRDYHSPERLGLMGELRKAIEADELVLHYQPKCMVRTGEITGVEALVRWDQPGHGLRSPGEFVPLAEQGGLIFPLTTWVLDQALRQLRTWLDSGRELEVSVNLSLRNLNDSDFVSTLEGLLQKWSVPPSSLKLELTETAVMDDPEVAMLTLTRIHDMGVKISIDDFGTGYSSLRYLTMLPVDEIKIDRSFVTDMTTNRDHAFIVRSTVDLGHNLALRVVAEGVEDEQTWDLLGVLGCDIGQGYFLGHPVTPLDLTVSLPRKNRGH